MAGAGASQPEPQAPVNDPALPLLSEVRFREDYRCFTAGQVLTFEKGVNLLVGEQGSGKSTLISLLRDRVAGRDRFATPRALARRRGVAGLRALHHAGVGGCGSGRRGARLSRVVWGHVIGTDERTMVSDLGDAEVRCQILSAAPT